MKKLFGILTIILAFSACKKDKINETVDDFLLKKNVQNNEIIGEWTWVNSHGGGYGMIFKTPQTEGYSKTILFNTDQSYQEYIDEELNVDSYFRIDSTDTEIYGDYLFLIDFYKQEENKEFLIQEENDTAFLYLYDVNNCKDCISTHVYFKALN